LTGPILLGLFGRRVTGSQATVGAVAGLLLAGWLYWLSPWENDSLIANLAALFVPIAVSYARASRSDRRYSWDDDEPTATPADEDEFEFVVGR
jgi:Na+/proline symporter